MKLGSRLLAQVVLIGLITYFLYSLPSFDHEIDPVSPQFGTPKCKNVPCLQLLSEQERLQYDLCYNKSVSEKILRKFGPIQNGSCHFLHGVDSRYPVGLGSFQGSGNTWLRGLLEKMTGICTGIKSIVCLATLLCFLGMISLLPVKEWHIY